MKLESLLFTLAVLVPRIVVGTPTKTSAGPHNPRVTINISGTYIWRKIFELDNRKNKASVDYSYKVTESGLYNSRTFNNDLMAGIKNYPPNSTQFEPNASYSPVFIGFRERNGNSDDDVYNVLQKVVHEQKEDIDSFSKSENRKLTVGAGTRVILYQRVFELPGIMVKTGVLKWTPRPLPVHNVAENVTIEMVMMPRKYLKELKAVCSDIRGDAPPDRVRDWFGGTTDINDTYGGKFCWIVPVMTTNVNEAQTRVELSLPQKADPRYVNLAQGTKGSQIYLHPIRQSDKNLFVSGVTLARFESDKYSSLNNTIWPGLPKGYTRNINRKRQAKGQYLYLVWRLERTYM
ncbi:hypothetical protein E4T56_gene177 [Termitomyces sp. T112]|nr:hypothetical protein E4T56_gene177 [Termitomyces sp. T112]